MMALDGERKGGAQVQRSGLDPAIASGGIEMLHSVTVLKGRVL